MANDGGKVINLNDRRDDNKKYFTALALCLACNHRWIASVLSRTSLFKLQCPICMVQDSFASLLTDDYKTDFMENFDGI